MRRGLAAVAVGASCRIGTSGAIDGRCRLGRQGGRLGNHRRIRSGRRWRRLDSWRGRRRGRRRRIFVAAALRRWGRIGTCLEHHAAASIGVDGGEGVRGAEVDDRGIRLEDLGREDGQQDAAVVEEGGGKILQDEMMF